MKKFIKMDLKFFDGEDKNTEAKNVELKELKSTLNQGIENLKSAIEAQKSEIKEHGETSKETVAKLEEAENQVKEVSEEMKEIQKKFEELEVKFQRPDYQKPEARKSIGQMFVDSDQYKEMVKNNKKTSDLVVIKSFFPRKSTLTSATGSGGALVVEDRHSEIITPPERILRIRDLLNIQTTDSNAIEYVEEIGFTNNAAPTAETSEKPESALTFELKTQSVKTIAHWIPASRQILDDASQIRSYIDNRLTYGLKVEEEDQILFGSGVSPNLPGIMNNASIQTYKWSDGTSGDTKIDCIRRAITKAVIAEYPVTGVVLHPNDKEDIDLAKGSNNHYIWVNVAVGGQNKIWGVPIIETTAMNEGEALLGAFGIGAWLWDREQASVRIAEQHEDFFIKNMVAILAEERLALTVFRPEAFVSIEFDNAPTSGT